MQIGKEIRLDRILNRQTNRTVIVPMDHGVTMGPIEGLVSIPVAANQIAEGGANAAIVHKGAAVFGHRGYGKDLGLIIHLSASTSLSPRPDSKVLVTSIEHAIRLGADGVSIHVNLGAENEDQMLKDLGEIADRCFLWGMPLLAMMYPRGPKIANQFDVSVVKHAARVGAELGADIVKVNYTGDPETFRRVVEGCSVMVVIAGGEKVETDMDLFRMIEGAMEAGATGVSIGRNAFQHKNPTLITRVISHQVHEGLSADEAMERLNKGYEENR
ncbi:MAG: 2-amino-3,7-dideoxy-D-threo-hept-6-ulosonate synthase [bacterium]